MPHPIRHLLAFTRPTALYSQSVACAPRGLALVTYIHVESPVVDINLAQLREMHTRLPTDLALVIVGRAALALERNAHASGVRVSLDLERVLSSGLLSWPGADLSTIDQHDHNRITEDGAEAVALALGHRHRAWRVIRRMQREEHADWLLEDANEGGRRVIALEVSGVDRGSIGSRLSEKLAQVAKSVDVDERWAGVVGFEEPTAALHFTKRQSRGN
jgi:hypothetical protein